MTTWLHRRAVTLAVLAVAVAACGTDDGGEVRNIGPEDAGSASASGTASATGTHTGSASATGTGSASATGTGAAACEPVNPSMENDADTEVTIVALDYAFAPADIEVDAGVITFQVDNQGTENHELAFLPGGGDVPFTAGEPDETALEQAGAFELEAFGPGQTCHATYDLEPGTYTLFCIVETADGTTHYELGMRGTLVVDG